VVAPRIHKRGETYGHGDYDSEWVARQVAQFGDQTRQYLAGALSDDEFAPPRPRNRPDGQRHAPMLRGAIRADRSAADAVAGLDDFASVCAATARGPQSWLRRRAVQSIVRPDVPAAPPRCRFPCSDSRPPRSATG
jgi:hypothetical protein